jgi:hypothetical protein
VYGLREVSVSDDLILLYFAGYASLCDSSSSGYWDADGSGWNDRCAEAVS